MNKTIRVLVGCLCVLAMLLTTVHYSLTVSATTHDWVGSWDFHYNPCTSIGLEIVDIYHDDDLIMNEAYQTGISYYTSGVGWTHKALSDASCSSQVDYYDSALKITAWFDWNNFDGHYNAAEYIVSIQFNEDGGNDNLWIYQGLEVYTSVTYVNNFQVFWKMDWNLYNGNYNYIDSKVSGSWTQLETENYINALTSGNGVRYRTNDDSVYGYATSSDVGTSGGISECYFGAFQYDYEGPYDFFGNKNPSPEDISNQNIVGGFEMADSSPSANTLEQANVVFHVDS